MGLKENLLRGIYAYGGSQSPLVNVRPMPIWFILRAVAVACAQTFEVCMPTLGKLRISKDCCGGPLLMHSLTCGLSTTGFERPSSIQSKGIVPFGKGLDVIQQAQSGTGKTATFCAGILQSLDFNLNECQALVLAPTRELAQQIEKVMRALGDYLQVSLMKSVMSVVLCMELVMSACCWLPAVLLCSRPARLADRVCKGPCRPLSKVSWPMP